MGNHNKSWGILFLMVTAFSILSPPKRIVNNKNTLDSAAVHKTMPGSVSMGPSTFGVIAQVLKVTEINDSLSHQKYYKADVLIRQVTGRGSSLTEIVTAGDTINCAWPAYHANDKQTTDNIANKKLMEAVIEERLGRPGESYTAFVIQSYRFR